MKIIRYNKYEKKILSNEKESTERWCLLLEIKQQHESWEEGGAAANFSVNIYMVIVYRNPKFEDNSTLCPILYPAVLSEKSIKSIQSNKLLRKLHLTDERMD